MVSDALQLPFRYLAWHYTRAIGESIHLWKVGFRFVTRLCAVPLHLRTLVSPFERLAEPAAGDLGERAEAVVVNSLMRIVGFVLRLGVLALALVLYAGVTVLGVAALVSWVLLPLVMLASLWIGFRGLLAGTFK
jgi:hypothetical protein